VFYKSKPKSIDEINQDTPAL